MKNIKREYNISHHELFVMFSNAMKHRANAEYEYKNEIKRLKDAEFRIESARNNIKKYNEEYEDLAMIEKHTPEQKSRFHILQQYLKSAKSGLHNAKLERNRFATNIQYSLKPKYHSARNRESTFMRLHNYVDGVIENYIDKQYAEELNKVENWIDRAELRYKLINEQNINIKVYNGDYTSETGYLAYEVNTCGESKISFERA